VRNWWHWGGRNSYKIFHLTLTPPMNTSHMKLVLTRTYRNKVLLPQLQPVMFQASLKMTQAINKILTSQEFKEQLRFQSSHSKRDLLHMISLAILPLQSHFWPYGERKLWRICNFNPTYTYIQQHQKNIKCAATEELCGFLGLQFLFSYLTWIIITMNQLLNISRSLSKQIIILILY
jgi:hypothetical protein